MKFLFIASCFVGFAGLVGCMDSTDDSMYLTGTEEFAVRTENGQFVCESPKKVLICHIPPGNPDNAHTICVSEHAVDPHQTHHGDTIGACAGDGGDDGGDDGSDDPPTDDPPTGEDPPPPPPDPTEPPPVG
jgi:hypothetical protein